MLASPTLRWLPWVLAGEETRALGTGRISQSSLRAWGLLGLGFLWKVPEDRACATHKVAFSEVTARPQACSRRRTHPGVASTNLAVVSWGSSRSAGSQALPPDPCLASRLGSALPWLHAVTQLFNEQNGGPLCAEHVSTSPLDSTPASKALPGLRALQMTRLSEAFPQLVPWSPRKGVSGSAVRAGDEDREGL